MLRVNKINTKYENIQVLFDLSLTIDQGEIICLLGANGAGKSTTLNTVIGIARSPTGTIHFMNARIDKREPHQIIQSGISVVPEGKRIFPKLTVFENLKMGALFIETESVFQNNLQKVYELFPILEKRKHQLAGTFSGGEQGMLAIGRAMVSNPKLMLLDEPSLGLAPMVVDQVFKSVRQINQNGMTILLVEQNATKAFQIASRGYILQKGEIIADGRVADLIENKIIKKAYLSI
jgi:branched-chain amino acid transport system ATP-binding protein